MNAPDMGPCAPSSTIGAQSTQSGGAVEPWLVTPAQTPGEAKPTHQADPPVITAPTPTDDQGSLRVRLINTQFSNTHPTPNVDGDNMVTPMNTTLSPQDPGPIVPPVITSADIAVLHSSATAPELTRVQREDIPELAEAMVLYGEQHLPLALKAYSITAEQFEQHVVTSPVYAAAAALAKAQLAEDPHLGMRKKAKEMLDGHLETLSYSAANADEHKDRINAIKVLAEIADVGPKKQKVEQERGPAININFGATLGAALSTTIEAR